MIGHGKSLRTITGVALALVAPLGGMVVATLVFPTSRYENLSLHCLTETMCGMMAIVIGWILCVERLRRRDSQHLAWVTVAFFWVGVLNTIHAALLVGATAYWFSSLATLSGGLLIAGVWLPDRCLGHVADARWPWRALGLAVVFGMVSGADSSGLSSMISNEGLVLATAWMNQLGAIGYLIAAIFFGRRFVASGDRQDWLLAVHSMLSSMAGMLFEWSAVWSAAWWWWHVLRLVAFAAVLVIAVEAFLGAQSSVLLLNQQLTAINQSLDLTVAARTKELEISESRFALSVHGTADGIWDWNVVTNEVYAAPRFKQLLGFRDDEIDITTGVFYDRLHPDDLERTQSAVNCHLSEREPFDIEFRLRMKSGEYRWFRSRGEAVWDEHGQAIRMAGSISDITARKETEEALNYERFLFNTLLSHLPDPIYFKDAAGRFLRVSSSLAQRLGNLQPEEVIGKTDRDFFPEDYAAEALADEMRLMSTGIALTGKEERPQWVNRTEGWVLTNKIPLRDGDGRVIGTFGISHDITAVKQAEERFRVFVEATPHPILAVDDNLRIQFANESSLQLLGFSRDELEGQSVNLIIPHWREATGSETPDSVLAMLMNREVVGRRSDGSEFPASLELSPVSLEQPGRKECVVLASIFDLTLQKQAERTLTLAKEAAESANKSKRYFVANMRHEIRTPMNSILGFTELLRRRVGTPDEQQIYLDTIHASGRHLLAVIDDILDVSKIEAGQMEFEKIPCSLHKIISEVLSALKVRAQEKLLDIHYEWTGSIPETIESDPGRIRQLLFNLVGNAIKFTDQGSVTVRVSLDQATPSPRVCLEIQDTGIGISPKQAGRLFTPFKQADSSVTRRFGGTGLGLAISRHIARQLGGDITLKSQLHVGSTFRVTLATGSIDQVRLLDSPPTNLLPHQQDNCEQWASSPLNIRVLLVEDGESNRQLIRLVLRQVGADVVCAENGKDALDCLSASRFDVILMDMQMPVLDGYSATQLIRDMGITTPIIAITAHAMLEDERRCLEAGCSHYLPKPIDVDRLLQTVADAVSLAQTDSPHEAALHELSLTSDSSKKSFVAERRRHTSPKSHLELAASMSPIISTLPTEQLLFRELVMSFIRKLSGQLDTLQAAVNANDLDRVAELAHWLKGTGGTMGFDCFTEPAALLERHALSHRADAIPEQLHRISSLAARITASA